MADGIHSVTPSEWELVHQRLVDLENLVTDMKLKLEILGECKCRSSNLETRHSDDEESETVVGLNTKSNSPSASAASGILGISGQSTIQSEEILTFGNNAGRNVNNTADSTSTPSTGSNLSDGDRTSANTAANGKLVSSKSTLRLSNEIGIQDVEKYRRAELKLKRCDQVEVMGSLRSSKFRVANSNSTLTVTSESHISSKKRPALRRKRNGTRADHPSTPPLPHEKRFVCRFCSKRFDRKSNLTDHIRIHTGERPFQCNICTKKFILAVHLKTHERIHSGDKPYECGFCSKKFNQTSILVRHTRVHTGDKPYECGFCSKKFGRNQSLTLHVRSHTRERPYTCQLRSKTFAARSNWRSHLKVHTKEKPYSCPFCPKVFTENGSLKKHLPRHEGETTTTTTQPQVQIHHEEVS